MPQNIKNKDVNKITVLIVNYNVAKNINKLLNSLILIDNEIFEIIIIDNNSSDIHLIKPTTRTRMIINNSNLGYAKASNIGIKQTKTLYVLLINPDCYLENTSILNSIKTIKEDNKIGAIGGKIKKPNSNNYHYSANSKINFFIGLFEFTNLKKIFKNNYFSNKFWMETSKLYKPTNVESLCGAYTIIRKKINNKLNLFDERYFMYMEDVDFGNKINNEGYKVVFDPNSEITHIGGKSSNSKYNIVLSYWYASRKIYFKKHFSKLESTVLTLLFNIEEILLIIIHKLKSTPYV